MIEQARMAYPEVSVRRLCGLHGVSRSWYVHQQRQSQHDKRDEALAQASEAVVLKWSGYGYRRVTHNSANRSTISVTRHWHKLARQ